MVLINRLAQNVCWLRKKFTHRSSARTYTRLLAGHKRGVGKREPVGPPYETALDFEKSKEYELLVYTYV